MLLYLFIYFYPLSIDSFASIFSHSEGCLFVFIVSFAMQKLLSFIRSHLFIFVFISITLGGGSKKNLLWFISKSVLPMFFSKRFIVSGLTFRSLIHLSLFLCMVLGSVLISFFYMELSSFRSTTYWRDCLFYIVYPCLLCHKWVDNRCLALYPAPLIFISVFVPVPYCLDYCSFVV